MNQETLSALLSASKILSDEAERLFEINRELSQSLDSLQNNYPEMERWVSQRRHLNVEENLCRQFATQILELAR